MTTPLSLQQDIIHLKNRGYSSRFLAEKFLGSSKKKSTVNDIVSRYNKEHGNAYDQQESNQLRAYCIEDLGYYKRTPEKKVDPNSWRELENAYYEKKTYAKTKVTKEGSLKIMFIPDSQVRPGESTEYLAAIGQYIVDKKPDVVVCAGDFWDFPSLSSYDKGKTAFEGRRLMDDINAGKIGMKILLKPLKDYQAKNSDYKPRMVFTEGNHEGRLKRIPESSSEYEGFIGMHLLELEKTGKWFRSLNQSRFKVFHLFIT